MWKTSTVLLWVVLVLLSLGIVMLASTSGIKALSLYNDSTYFVKRQAAWLALAVVCGVFAGFLDYRRWKPWALPIALMAMLMLVLVFVPHVGVKIGGSRRWLHLGPLSIQSSEIAKFALILALSWWMSKEQRRVSQFKRGALIPALIMGGMVGLILCEPDFGTTMLCAVVGLSIMFVGGTRVPHLLACAVPCLAGFVVLVLHNRVRMLRIVAFMDPDKYAQSYAFQLVSSINSFISGGLTGAGLGESLQKHFYLPEAHTDFIFAIIGEELGMAASLLVVALFAGIFLCGLIISFKATDMFGRLMAFGITLMICLQAVINIGVVTGCMPTKGLPLPFISFGGSSLVMTLLGIGVLFNIASQVKTKRAHPPAQIHPDPSRHFQDF